MDGVFGGDAALTREQLAVMLWRALDTPAAEETALAGFADADAVSDWAQGALAWAVEARIITGRDAETLAPKDAVTRAELAVILSRTAAAIQID